MRLNKKFILVIPVLVIILLMFKSKTLDENNTDINTVASEPRNLSQEFKDYWYNGTAELNSYSLEQARYGEIRKGTAIAIFVSEDFLTDEQVKANRPSGKSVSVLKFNATKNFNTGIYPYSIMSSTFYPLSQVQHAIKVSSSIQEWCGHSYTQLNNRADFDLVSHTYFEGLSDKQFSIKKAWLENELWIQLRVDPSELVIGTAEVIPAIEYTQMMHRPLKAYTAKIKIEVIDENISQYQIHYPKLKRSLNINYTTAFPHKIMGWTETFKSGFGKNAKEMTTKATLLKSIRSPYWTKNKLKDEVLRDSLGL